MKTVMNAQTAQVAPRSVHHDTTKISKALIYAAAAFPTGEAVGELRALAVIAAHALHQMGRGAGNGAYYAVSEEWIAGYQTWFGEGFADKLDYRNGALVPDLEVVADALAVFSCELYTRFRPLAAQLIRAERADDMNKLVVLREKLRLFEGAREWPGPVQSEIELERPDFIDTAVDTLRRVTKQLGRKGHGEREGQLMLGCVTCMIGGACLTVLDKRLGPTKPMQANA